MCIDMDRPSIVSASPGVDTGFRVFSLGPTKVVALSDGYFELDAGSLLIEPAPASIERLLGQAGLQRSVRSTVNAFLVDTGSRCILIDAGAGGLQDATLGRLEASLQAAGYAPECIDDVLLTHLHPDHVGGLCHGGRAVFPRARVHVEAREASFWRDPSNVDRVGPSVTATFAAVSTSLGPYLEERRLCVFETGAVVVDGIHAIGLEGHTAGHTGFRLESGGHALIACGDAFHVAAVQCAEPAVAIHYDSSPAQACIARERLFSEAADNGFWLAAAHAPFPGIGRIVRVAGAYAWEPPRALDLT